MILDSERLIHKTPPYNQTHLNKPHEKTVGGESIKCPQGGAAAPTSSTQSSASLVGEWKLYTLLQLELKVLMNVPSSH